jgi:hypothetical protein
MSKTLVNKISTVKTAAKRLKKSIPEKSHMQLLDIATHAITGKSNFHELNNIGLNYSYLNPFIKVGNWSFNPDDQSLSFSDTEYSPYVIFLEQVNTSTKFLDFILQLNKKRNSDAPEWINCSPAFETDNFISLMEALCNFYFDNSVQGVFSPKGEFKEIDWERAINIKSGVDDKFF